MRIIAGKAKGTKLLSFKGNSLRPTLDRVKESFFNQVSPVIEGACFLDLFAGTGNIGIEALSRGAAKVVFVEIDQRSQELIHKNLEKCRFSEGPDWKLLKSDALAAIRSLEEKQYQFDLVYVDPPFEEEIYEDCLVQLSKSRLLRATSMVIVEHYHKNILHQKYDKINITRKRRLGDSCLSFFCLNQPVQFKS